MIVCIVSFRPCILKYHIFISVENISHLSRYHSDHSCHGGDQSKPPQKCSLIDLSLFSVRLKCLLLLFLLVKPKYDGNRGEISAVIQYFSKSTMSCVSTEVF